MSNAERNAINSQYVVNESDGLLGLGTRRETADTTGSQVVVTAVMKGVAIRVVVRAVATVEVEMVAAMAAAMGAVERVAGPEAVRAAVAREAAESAYEGCRRVARADGLKHTKISVATPNSS